MLVLYLGLDQRMGEPCMCQEVKDQSLAVMPISEMMAVWREPVEESRLLVLTEVKGLSAFAYWRRWHGRGSFRAPVAADR